MGTTSNDGKSVLQTFRRSWGQLLLLSIATRIVVSVVLLPVLAVILRLFLFRRENPVLSDTEIADFFFSPIGIIALIIVGGFWLGIAFVEQSGLMTVGYTASDGRRLSWFSSLRYVIARLAAILLLGVHMLVRVLVIVIPFAVPAGLVYWFFLSDYDINYYLQNKPPELYWAGGIIAILVVAMLGILAAKIASWFFALPALLFEGLKPGDSLRYSVDTTRGHRWRLVGWLTVWLLLGTAVSLVITWLIGFTGRAMISGPDASIGWVAFVIGAVGVTTLLANTLISVFAAALFALIVIRLYRRIRGMEDIAPDLEDIRKTDEQSNRRIPAKGILAGCLAVMVVALLLSWLILSNMKADDDVLIIAHRGSAATAPENTMAAVEDAIKAGTDFVEIDVQETADGIIAVFHDSDFMKTARDPLKIWDATQEDLLRLDVGSHFDPSFASERVPTLDQVLQACKDRAKVDIELKYYGHDEELEKKVIEIVERHGMEDQVILMSLKSDKVAKIKAMRPDWTYGLLSCVQLGDISKFDVDFLAVNTPAASRKFIQRAKSSGFDVYVWTVNDPFQMSAMMSRGVDGIITDKPALAREVLDFRSQLSPVERLLIGIGTEVGVFSAKDWVAHEKDA